MIIFGLGNQGLKYRSTRHNVGYLFLNYLAKTHHKRFRAKQNYKVAKFSISGKEIILIKPQCWMNQSGVVIARLLKDSQNDFLVVVDDINLPLGKIRLRRKGSDGGHHGLGSIVSTLDTSHFSRLRIGIGYPQNNAVDYVLGSFKRGEKEILRMVMSKCIKGIEMLVKSGFIKAQNYINSIDLSENQKISDNLGVK